MIINHNIAALNTYRQLTSVNNATGKSLEKLSAGLRINKAADDAAGLAISEKMRGQIRGLEQAQRNAQDGISLIQTAEGALNETHSILQRMRELANQSANGTNTDIDRQALQDEIAQLTAEIDRIGESTEFNTIKLLNGNLQSTGAVAGENQIVGSEVLKQTNASVTATSGFAIADYSGIDLSASPTDTITVDGVEITVDWTNKLTETEKALIDANYSGVGNSMTDSQKEDIKAALERVINESIDEYNAANPNSASVNHINIYENAGNNLVIESTVAGENSKIAFAGTQTSVLGNYFTTGTAASVNGDNQITTAVANADTLTFQINGIQMQTSDFATGYDAGASADTVAADIQAMLNAAISGYNSGAGLSSGDEGFIENVIVDAKDGRFYITSASGDISFVEQEGFTTVEDLGLTQAQTESASQGALSFHIGANRGQTMGVSINDMRTTSLGINSIDISSAPNASIALDKLDSAIEKVSTERSKLGAVQNRLEHTINNLSTASENLTAAESRIRDVDMASEMMEFTKKNIISQAATSMLAQANQQPQQILQLLR